jgi:hypothetical protein
MSIDMPPSVVGLGMRVTWPMVASARQSAMPAIGYNGIGMPKRALEPLPAFAADLMPVASSEHAARVWFNGRERPRH